MLNEYKMYTNASKVVHDALRRMDEHSIWNDLRNFMSPRIASAQNGDIVTQSFDSIIDEAKNQ